MADQAVGQEAPALSQEDQKRQEEARATTLAALALSLAKSRADAISGREASGIEREWLEDEEHYEGIDDANRGEMAAWRSKPPGQSTETMGDATSSTVFVNITRPYCDAASARVSDMLLPTDDRAWSLGPTPIPELIGAAEGKFTPAAQQHLATASQGNPQAQQTLVQQAVQQATQLLAEAREKADKAQQRIEDWHNESQYHAEMRSVIEDAAKLGSGVLKGPVPQKRRQVAFKDGALIVKEEIKPGSKRISPWNFYPDPACGENIHNGAHTWEKDDLTSKQLEALKGTPGYLDSEIDACLVEGPHKATKAAPVKIEPDSRIVDTSKRFEIWYYTGNLTREDMEAARCTCEGDGPVNIPALITMVNNRVIKAVLNPLDTGDFPYDVMVWQKRSGMPWGIGVARQIRTSQRMVNAASRNMMDNAGRAGGPQLVIKQGLVTPHDGIYECTPWKVWVVGEDGDLDHLENAFRFVTIPMLQKELMEIIQFGLKMAEDVSGLPLLLQGQQGKAPDTLGGMQMLNNNASTVLRRIARLFDDLITEPHVRRYYAFLLQYGEDEEKGDYVIDARGSSALVERDLQNHMMPQLMQLSANPIYGWDPKKAGAEWLKSMRFDPKRFEFDDEKWQQIMQNMQKGDPRVAIAQMQMNLNEKLETMKLQFEQTENEKDRQLDMLLKSVDERMTGMKLQGEKEINFDDLKAMLADTVMRLRTQTQLSLVDHRVDLHKHHSPVLKPPTEPPGRAGPGRGFEA
jgi:hypothetical protein